MNIQHTIPLYIFRYFLILSFITICNCFEIPLTTKTVVTSKTPIVNIHMDQKYIRLFLIQNSQETLHSLLTIW